MLNSISLGEFLFNARAVSRVEVISVKSMPSQRVRIPILSEVTIKLVRPLSGTWEKRYSVIMAGGTLKGYSFEVEDQPIPKKGKLLLAARMSDDPNKLGFAFFLDALQEKTHDADWKLAKEELSENLAKRKKQPITKFKSSLLRRPVAEFVRNPGDPVWGGNYPTSVTLEVWDNTSDLGAEEAFEAIQRAINTWNNAGANFSIRRVTRAGGLAAGNDRRMIVRWSPNGPANAWATASWTWNTITSQFIDCDIQFWDNMAFSTGPAAGTGDVESIALHELGHFIGLDTHSTGANDVMQATIGAGITRRILSARDIARIQGLYGTRPVANGLVYRWWNGRDHFYTPQVYGELAPDVGYNYEGAAFSLFPSGTANTTRFFRWYNPASGDHFYTTDPNGELAPNDYVYEGSIGNIAPSQIAGTVPLFRWYNPGTGDHFYTTDPNGELAPAGGYVGEGTAGFVLP